MLHRCYMKQSPFGSISTTYKTFLPSTSSFAVCTMHCITEVVFLSISHAPPILSLQVASFYSRQSNIHQWTGRQEVDTREIKKNIQFRNILYEIQIVSFLCHRILQPVLDNNKSIDNGEFIFKLFSRIPWCFIVSSFK